MNVDLQITGNYYAPELKLRAEPMKFNWADLSQKINVFNETVL